MLLVAAVAFLVYRAWVIVEPLLVAAVLATAIWPWVSRISRRPLGPRGWRVPRLGAAALIYLLTFASAGLVVWLTLVTLVPHLERLIQTFPAETALVREYLEPFRSGNVAEGARRVAEDMANEASRQQGGTGAGQFELNAGQLALALSGGVVNIALVLIFTFFLLVRGDRVAGWVLLAVPRDRRPNLRELAVRIRDRTSRWVLAQVLYAAVSGLIVGLSAWLLQVPSPWLYGMAGALLAVLPGVGPALALVPAFFVVLGQSTWQPVAVLAVGALFYLADATTISTRIYGEMMQLSMFVVFLAVLLGLALLGIWGAVIAAPVAVAVQMALKDHLHHERA